MNLKDTQKLIDFHYWARNRMLEAVEAVTPEQFTRQLGSSFGSLRDTIVHTLSAECIWLSRWKGQPMASMLDPKDYPDISAVRRAWENQEASLRSFFERQDEDGIRKVIAYKSLAGIDSQSVLWQMLQHVVNHA